MTYTHISWFSEEKVEKARQENRVIKMCETCGNTNPNKMDCPNCDINFKEYIYVEDV